MEFILGRYRRANIVYWGTNLFLILLSIFGLFFEPPARITSFLPFGNLYLEMPVIFISLPIAATMGALIGGYLLVPLYLRLHKVIFRGSIYEIKVIQNPKEFKGIFQGFYPALLAFNLNSMIIEIHPKLLDWLLSPELLKAPFMYQYSFGNVLLTLGTVTLGMALFSPTYFLLDSGIVYSTKERVKGSGRPAEERTVGGWFYDYLRGYAGLSVFFSYLLFVFRYISTYEMELIFGVFWLGLPFFITINTIPTFIFLDMVRKRNSIYVREFTKKMAMI